MGHASRGFESQYKVPDAVEAYEVAPSQRCQVMAEQEWHDLCSLEERNVWSRDIMCTLARNRTASLLVDPDGHFEPCEYDCGRLIPAKHLQNHLHTECWKRPRHLQQPARPRHVQQP